MSHVVGSPEYLRKFEQKTCRELMPAGRPIRHHTAAAHRTSLDPDSKLDKPDRACTDSKSDRKSECRVSRRMPARPRPLAPSGMREEGVWSDTERQDGMWSDAERATDILKRSRRPPLSFFPSSLSFLTQQLVPTAQPRLSATTFLLPPSIKSETASKSISEYRHTAPLAGKPDLLNPHPLRPHRENLGLCVPNNHDLEQEPHVVSRPRPGIHSHCSGSSFC